MLRLKRAPPKGTKRRGSRTADATRGRAGCGRDDDRGIVGTAAQARRGAGDQLSVAPDARHRALRRRFRHRHHDAPPGAAHAGESRPADGGREPSRGRGRHRERTHRAGAGGCLHAADGGRLLTRHRAGAPAADALRCNGRLHADRAGPHLDQLHRRASVRTGDQPARTGGLLEDRAGRPQLRLRRRRRLQSPGRRIVAYAYRRQSGACALCQPGAGSERRGRRPCTDADLHRRHPAACAGRAAAT